jgi:hypothetical protein
MEGGKIMFKFIAPSEKATHEVLINLECILNIYKEQNLLKEEPIYKIVFTPIHQREGDERFAWRYEAEKDRDADFNRISMLLAGEKE